MKVLFIIITVLLTILGCGIESVSKSAIHEILAVLVFMGALAALGIFAVLCKLDDIKEVLRKRR
jgi:cytosine/uracil/thiamine/allantoin permease